MSMRCLFVLILAILKTVLSYLLSEADYRRNLPLPLQSLLLLLSLPPHPYLPVQAPSTWCVYTACKRINGFHAATSMQALRKS